MTPLAVSFAVLAETGSLADVGYVQAARFAPLVALVLVGGVFADRIERRRVMIAADVARVLSQGAFAALVITHHAALWELVALQMVGGAGSAFYAPAAIGLLQEMLPREQLQAANSLRSLATSIGQVAGPALAGALIALASPGWAIAADAATFLVSACALSQLVVQTRTTDATASPLRDLRDGWREFRSRRWLWMVVGWSSLYNLFVAAPFIVLGVGIANESLGGASAWALILAASGIGAVLGGLVGLRYRPRRPLLLAILGMLVQVPPLWLLAATAPLAIITVAALLGGIAFAYFGSVWETTLQRAIPASLMSRVSSYDWFGSLVFYPLGMAVAAPIAVTTGLHAALWLAGLWALLSTLVLVCSSAVRAIDAVASPPRRV